MAIEHFIAKGLKPTFAWQDMLGAEHDAAFTVAKMMDTDLLQTVQTKMQAALENGETFQEFSKDLIPTLKKAGWWGKADMLDPKTGKMVASQLGSASRLQTIFRSNMQSAYSVGQWDGIVANAKHMPYLLYDAVDDHRTRPEHAALDGKAHPITSNFWQTHFPPNGWNCRCGTIQLDKDDLAEMGIVPDLNAKSPTKKWTNPRTGNVLDVPVDVDPGWDHNPGMARMKKLHALDDAKAKAIDNAAQQAALKKAKALKAIEQAEYEKKLAADKELHALQQQETAAVAELAKHTAEGTQFLAAAIKKLKKNQPNLAPIDLLKQAKHVTELEKKNSLLKKWKAAAVSGKQQKPEVQAYVSSLPQEAQDALQDAVDAKTGAKAAKQAQADALDELMDISNGDPAAIHPDLKAAYDDLIAAGVPESIKGDTVKILAQVKADAKLVKAKAEQAAKAELALIAKGESADMPSYKKTALEKFSKNGIASQLNNPQELIQLINAEAVVLKAAKKKASVLAGYKKSVIDGKVPSPQQTQFFNDLTDAEQAKVLAQIEAKKPVAPPPVGVDAPAPVVTKVSHDKPNMDALVQTGPQKGSNPGGKFQDTETGIEWYIKTPGDAAQAGNEVLTGKLYQLAGIEVPEMVLVQHGGVTKLASKIIDGLEENPRLLKGDKDLPGLSDGFVTDAWLANWDVVGMDFDNMLIKAGRVVRVDTGGGLRYRAQGELKKASLWGDDVIELQSLTDGSYHQTTSVFGKLSREQKIASARKVLAISDEDIRKVVEDFGPDSPLIREGLIDKLIARKAFLAKEFPEAKVPVKPDPPKVSPAQVNEVELEQVERARVNGYTRLTDKGDIEDHQVRINHYTQAGKPQTKLTLKLSPEALAKIDKQAGTLAMDTTPDTPSYSLQQTRQSWDETAKGIGRLAIDGDNFRAKDVTRLANTLKMVDADLAELKAGKLSGKYNDADASAMIKTLNAWQDEIRWMQSWAVEGDKAVQWRTMLKSTDLPTSIDEIVKAAAVSADPVKAIVWKMEKGTYRRMDTVDGHLVTSGSKSNVTGGSERLTTTINGVKINVYNSDRGAGFYIKGQVEVVSKGADAAAINKALAALEELGLDVSRATESIRHDLWLDQQARQMFFGRDRDFDTKLAHYSTLDTPEAKLAYLNKEAGFDLSKTETYQNREATQAFGHGRKSLLRADLDTPEFDKWADDHLLYHSLGTLSKGGNNSRGSWEDYLKPIFNGGGMLTSLLDRVRRGLPMTSQAGGSDFSGGGAASIFTRIKRKNSTDGSSSSRALGIYWKPRKHMKRMDRISLDSDNYGRVTEGTRKSDGIHTIDRWTDAANMQGDETTFKDGLSLFDDLEKIIVYDEAERQTAIKWLKANKMGVWPDGRKVEDIIHARNG